MTLNEKFTILFGENYSLPAPQLLREEKERRLLAAGCVKVGDIWYRNATEAVLESGIRRGIGGMHGQWVIDRFCTYPSGGQGITPFGVDVVGMA